MHIPVSTADQTEPEIYSRWAPIGSHNVPRHLPTSQLQRIPRAYALLVARRSIAPRTGSTWMLPRDNPYWSTKHRGPQTDSREAQQESIGGLGVAKGCKSMGHFLSAEPSSGMTITEAFFASLSSYHPILARHRTFPEARGLWKNSPFKLWSCTNLWAANLKPTKLYPSETSFNISTWNKSSIWSTWSSEREYSGSGRCVRCTWQVSMRVSLVKTHSEKEGRARGTEQPWTLGFVCSVSSQW